jgi:hypothetical protein
MLGSVQFYHGDEGTVLPAENIAPEASLKAERNRLRVRALPMGGRAVINSHGSPIVSCLDQRS